MNLIITLILFLAVAVICVSAAVIIQIRSKKSLLIKEEPDFIEEIIQNKKKSLMAVSGGFSFRNYILFMAGAPVLIGLVFWMFTSNFPMSIIFSLIGLSAPEIYIRVTNKKQKRMFDERYARALRSMASALRSNQTIQQAVDEVGKNVFIHESIREGFRQISSDLQVGIPVKEAFERFAGNSGSNDAKDVASAISMQNEVGGNEAQIISSISQNISDRLMVRKEIKSLFADTSVMILVMDIMPVIILAGLYYGTPQYITPYFESPLMTMIFISLIAANIIGSFIIRRMARIAKEGA
jgi:tight adherence protein B